MKLYFRIFLLSIMMSIFFPNNGSCLWPFGKDNDYNEEEIIQEYIQFQKKSDFSDEMLKTIKKALKGKGKINFILRMAYMRLSYYKAVQDRDQTSIQKVSNEAESLLKGDHPLFRQHIREKKVRDFLLALKDARYNEKRSTNWLAFIIICVVCTAIGAIALGFLAGKIIGAGISAIAGAIIGIVGGISLYRMWGINFFYKVAVDFSDLPPVPFLG